jgi:tetratricopeptide (TPR) repeat protein
MAAGPLVSRRARRAYRACRARQRYHHFVDPPPDPSRERPGSSDPAEPPAAAGAPAADGGTVVWSPAGGPPQVQATTPLPASELLASRFRIVRFIGHGGMGDVYEAEDLELGERVALKTVRSEIAHLDGALDRFRREIHLARKVTHPNVCRIFDVFRHRPQDPAGRGAEVVFFSMELLAGETLEQRLRRGGRMQPPEVLPIVRQVADALTAAHRVGVIHRDLKPANIMLVPAAGEPRAVVTDFGLAHTRAEGESLLTVRGDLLGTPAYMAPEQVAGEEVTAATDIYALGAVTYEMVTGGPPFVGENSFATAIKRLREDPPPPRLRAPDLDPAWESAILRCLERAPADRFAQARDVAAALAGEEVVPGPPGSLGQRRRQSMDQRRRPGLGQRLRLDTRARALTAAAAVAALLAALWFAGARWLGPARGPAAVQSSVGPLAALFRSPEELYADGVKLLGKLDAARARELFEKAIAARQDFWLAHSALAVALAELGHDDRAGKEAKLAFDRAPGVPRAERLLVTARFWQVARRWDKAVESYQELLRASPDNVEYGLGLVQALVGAGRGGEALQVVTALKGQPSAAAAGTRLDLAEAEVEKALSDAPRQGQAARRARERAEREGDELLTARALSLEAWALSSQGDRPAALAAFKKAEAIYAGAGDQRSLAQILAEIAVVLYFQGELNQARDRAKEALDIFKDLGDLRGQSHQLDTLAAIEGEQGNLVGAESRYEAAVDTYRRLGDREREAPALGNLGHALKMQGKLEEAAKRFDQALTLYHQMQNRLGEANQLLGLAEVSFDQLELDKADSHLARSITLATAIDDQTAIADALGLSGRVAAARGDLAAAQARHEEALTKGRGLGDKNRVAESQLTLAELELARGHPSPAQAYARSALSQFRSEHIQDGEAAAQALLARALLGQGSLAEARSAVEQADRLAAKSLEPEVRISVALAKARLAEAARPEEALRILAGALAQAQAAGLGQERLEVQLAIGEIEMKRGDRRHAAELLTALEREARHHGCNRIADGAARAQAAAGPHPTVAAPR